MCGCGQVMAWLDIERPVKSEIVWHAQFVTVGIDRHRVIARCLRGHDADGSCIGSAGAVFCIERCAISACEFIVADQLQIMGTVIVCRKPSALVDRRLPHSVLLLQFGARIGIVQPSVQLAIELANL